jgi:alpha-beta hydrolase superfamily lysophospholipase
VDFLAALVDYGKAQFKAPYAMMGCSNGGSIAYRFACNSTAAARIDAVTIACQSWY